VAAAATIGWPLARRALIWDKRERGKEGYNSAFTRAIVMEEKSQASRATAEPLPEPLVGRGPLLTDLPIYAQLFPYRLTPAERQEILLHGGCFPGAFQVARPVKYVGGRCVGTITTRDVVGNGKSETFALLTAARTRLLFWEWFKEGLAGREAPGDEPSKPSDQQIISQLSQEQPTLFWNVIFHYGGNLSSL